MTGEPQIDPACEDVARLVGVRTGLTFPAHRWATAERGIRRAMDRAGVRDIVAYQTLLERDAGALDDLIVELTVGETYFFREPAQFEFIRRVVLPDVARRRGPGHTLRAWSAGCASGEEAYSLAIVFEECGWSERVQLRATDISRAALTKARTATYAEWSLRGGAGARAYLEAARDRYVVVDHIRRRVTFEPHNLALDTYPSFSSGIWGMDLVLCRNVLIYLDAQTIARAGQRLFDSLAEGGWLITGPSDPPLGATAPYEVVVAGEGVFYRRPGRASLGAPTPPAPRVPAPAPTARPALPVPVAPDPLEQAKAAFSIGSYARVIELTHELASSPVARELSVRALANLDPVAAGRACADAVVHHPLSPGLHYLWAILLLDLHRDQDAARAARRVLYLDPSLAAAHFLLGTILRRLGDRDGALRAYRNARDLCAARPPGEPVPLAEGERAERLAEAAATQLALLADEAEDER